MGRVLGQNTTWWLITHLVEPGETQRAWTRTLQSIRSLPETRGGRP